ncbi:methylmalonyl-CoA mutase [Thermodesulfobacteriota bacterium]
MNKTEFLLKIEKDLKKWRESHQAEIEEAEKDERFTEDGIPLNLLYTPLDIEGDYSKDIGFPGDYPYTRGIEATGYRNNLWTLSQYAGFGNAKETNILFKNMIEHGNSPYLALDLPTQQGYDPDDSKALGEVGRTGTTVKSLRDWETIFDGISMRDLYIGTVANAQASVILAMHLISAEKQGADLKLVRGSLQNDILKEFTARGNYIFPVEPSLRLVTDVIEFCSEKLPAFWPICVCGSHFPEAGANRIHEVAFSMGNAFTYIDQLIEREIPIDRFVKGFFFLMKTNHFDLFEEVAKFRAMRKIWATTLKEKYGATDPESLKLKILGHSGGSLLTRERPELNIARTTLACLVGALGGIQLIGIRTMDEVFGIPTEKSEMIAIGSQHVVAHETGIPDVVDPLGGSYYTEALTKTFEKCIYDELDRIDQMGGMIRALETGYIKRTITEDAYKSHKQFESGKKIKVGANKYRIEEGEAPRRPYKLDPQEESRQIAELNELKRDRDNALVDKTLNRLRQIAQQPAGSENNLVPPIVEAVRVYATMGEICGVLREVFGEHQEPNVL